jgi:hypothetical protein
MTSSHPAPIDERYLAYPFAAFYRDLRRMKVNGEIGGKYFVFRIGVFTHLGYTPLS